MEVLALISRVLGNERKLALVYFIWSAIVRRILCEPWSKLLKTGVYVVIMYRSFLKGYYASYSEC